MQRIDKLVMMANQIARNLAVQGETKAIAGTADHIARFWDPRMRAALIAHAAEGGDDLVPTARAAVRSLPAPHVPEA